MDPGIGTGAKLMMRREFISLIGGTAAMSVAGALAQPAGASTVGFLYPGVAAMAQARIVALQEGLRAAAHGPVNLEARSSEGDPTKLAGLAADLIMRQVNAIVAVSPSAVRAAKSATTSIPIIADDLESDPVASGFVASLSHPGGNITGVFSDFPDFAQKWLELLKQAIPTLSRVVVLRDPATGALQWDAVRAAGASLGVTLDSVEIRSIDEVQAGFETAGKTRPDAIVVLSSPIFGTKPKLIAELALAMHIPIATLFTEIARAGGLMAYGPNLLGTFRQAGAMLAKVLQGARPADLPVERPTKFEMVINLRTARALGLAVPTSLLARADDVIE
jgi:putative ABC transport system substrate-binding protein